MEPIKCEGCGCKIKAETAAVIPSTKEFPALLVCNECEELDKNESHPLTVPGEWYDDSTIPMENNR